MNEVISGLQDGGNTIKSLTPEVLVIAVCIAVGYLVKRIPWISNRLIPTIVVLFGSLFYWCITPVGKVDETMRFPSVKTCLIGCLLGFGAWVVHNKFIKKWVTDDDDPNPDSPPPTKP